MNKSLIAIASATFALATLREPRRRSRFRRSTSACGGFWQASITTTTTRCTSSRPGAASGLRGPQGQARQRCQGRAA